MRILLTSLLISSCLAESSQGKKSYDYYHLINKGLVEHYVKHNCDSALHYLTKADEIYPDAIINGECLLIAQLYARKNDTTRTVQFITKALANKHLKIDLQDSCWYPVKNCSLFLKLAKDVDSLNSCISSTLDLELMNLINYAIGSDQYLRNIKINKYGLRKALWSKMLKDNDSINYRSIREYFQDKSPRNLPAILDNESYNNFSVLVNHFIISDLDKSNGNFFAVYISEEVDRGLFDNTFYPI